MIIENYAIKKYSNSTYYVGIFFQCVMCDRSCAQILYVFE